MNDWKNTPEGGGRLTPRSLLAVALVYLGVSYVCGGVTMALGFIAGPLASPAVGIILLVIAARIYRGENPLQ
jgi:hypothetical protein